MMDNIIWCEECKYFVLYDTSGEGFCEVYDKDTWYGYNAIDCPYFKKLEERR